MLLEVPSLLDADELRRVRARLDAADWIDGRATAGFQSARVKHNLQLAEDHPVARELGDVILGALERNPLFVSAALPRHVFPPLFSRYDSGHGFGCHVDNAVRQIAGTPLRLRTDVSATLFISEPDEYEGGELDIEDTYGRHLVKLPAGHLVLYPSSSLHAVRPMTSGVRLVSFFWIQSMVRDAGQRSLLFDLDRAIQRLGADAQNHPASVALTGVYHNLVRRWADL